MTTIDALSNLHLAVSALGFGIVLASILAVGAVGFTLQWSVTNILNISYGALMIGAAFVGYVANHAGAPVWASTAVGVVFGAVSSLLLSRGIFSPFAKKVGPRGMLIVTLSVGVVVENLFLAGFGPNFFSYRVDVGRTITWGAISLTVAQIYIIVISLMCMAAIHVLLRQTKLGRAMRATAANSSLARARGIPVKRVRDLAWLISGALCGLAGVILVLDTAAFQSTTAESFLILIIAAAVLGGIGSPYGAMIGALVIGLVTQLSTVVLSPGYQDVTAFVVLIVVLLARRGALFVGMRNA